MPLFALFEDKPVGCLTLVFNPHLKMQHIADIYGVFVLPEYRSQGIGSRLLASALSVIAENGGVCKVQLAVNSQQQPAISLYQKHGFVIVGTACKALFYEGKYYDELYMEKLM